MASKKTKKMGPYQEKPEELSDEAIFTLPDEGEDYFEEEISLGVTVNVQDDFTKEVERRRRKSGC
jgi:hypothetical protein